MRLHERMKKALSILLCLCMLLQNGPVMAFAADGDNLCEHHSVHTAECGYREGSAGSDCTHSHDDTCGYVKPVDEVKCACEALDENGALVHTEGCGYVAPIAGADCAHSHDGSCGYAEKVEPHACHYECTQCNAPSGEGGTAGDAPLSQESQIPASSPERGAECTCGAAEEGEDEHAPFCPQYVPSENPKCLCAEKCPEDAGNPYCEICYFDVAACTGNDTAIVYNITGECTWTFEETTGTLTISGEGKMRDYQSDASNAAPWCAADTIEKVKEVVIAEGVTNIGTYAFYKCANLTKVTIPSSVKSIGNYAFDGCYALKDLTIPEGVESIGTSVFYACQSLTKISLPSTLTTLGNYPFSECDGLTTLTIPKGVTTIGSALFESCSNLTSVTFAGNPETLGSEPFRDCTKLNSITVPCNWSHGESYTISDRTVNVTKPGHTMANGECTVCGDKAQAKIGATFYMTLAEAAAEVTEGGTIEVLTDVTIGEDETVTFAAFATLKVAEGKTVTCDGIVKIGEKEGIIFENTLYYYGGDVTNSSVGIPDSTGKPYYFKAGEGYIIGTATGHADTATGTMKLVNATVNSPVDFGIIQRDLTLSFTGNNTITVSGEGYNRSRVIDSMDADSPVGYVILSGEEGAVLNLCSADVTTGISTGIYASSVTVTGGTVNITTGNSSAGSSLGIQASSVTVEEGATLNLTFGKAASAVGANGLVSGEGTVNGLIFVPADNDLGVGFAASGNTVLIADFTAVDADCPFTVPAGSTLTVNENVTLDLSALAVADIDFTGTVINKGTILLPAGFGIPDTLTGGTVTIGEDSYTWNGEKWICPEGSHAFGTDGICTVCKAQAAVSVTKSVAGGIVGSGATTYYETLDEAIQAVKDCTAGDYATVKLLADIDLGSTTQSITGGVFTLDLNGKTITGSYKIVLEIVGGTVTIDDSANGGSIASTYITAFGVTVRISGGTVNVADGTIYTSEESTLSEAVEVTSGNLTVSGGNIIGGFSGTGVFALGGIVTITGGSISGGDGVYSQDSTLTVTGGNISGNFALHISKGNTTITGGTITGSHYDIREVDDSSIALALADGKTQGATFPGGITVGDTTLGEILGSGMAYWQGDKMIVPADGQTEITGGDVIIKAACKHENGTAAYAPTADGTQHVATWSCCGATVTESHTFADGACTGCALIGGYCGEEGNEQNVIWTFAGGTLTITGTGAMADYSHAGYSPWYDHRQSITNAVVGEGVTTLGSSALYQCEALTAVTLPETLESLGHDAFLQCSALAEISLPDRVTAIGSHAFAMCRSLREIAIPAYVTLIAEGAFDKCDSLQAFNVAESNTAYKSVDGVLFSKDGKTLVRYPSGKADTAYTIPGGVETIGKSAFNGSVNLTEVTISDGVTSLGGSAFSYCEKLKTVHFGTGLTAITDSAFACCTNLNDLVIPANIKSIDQMAFYYCTGLTTVTFDSADITVSGGTFDECSALATVNVPCNWKEATYTFGEGVTLNKVHDWVEGKCDICGETCAHSGGKATCTTLAVCDTCGVSYGELDTTNHDSSVAFDSNGFCPSGCYEPAEKVNGVYQIGNAGNLYWFADKVTNENATYGSANAILTADITVNENVLAADGTANAGTFRVWTPIGKLGVIDNKRVEYPYTGTFEGNGKTVSGLYYHDTTTILNAGLFSHVGEGGIVKNVGIADSYFCGSDSVGAVAGTNLGTVTGCHNSGTVSGESYVGGVVGANNGTVTGCSNTGTVSGSGNYVGGVVGYNSDTGTVTGCHNTGTVSGTTDVGGVVGYNYNNGDSAGTIEDCYNTGTVSGESNVGGVVGNNIVVTTVTGTVIGCYNTGTVSGDSDVGGVAGRNNATVTGCYFDSTVYTGDAIGTNSGGTVTDVEGKSTEQFKSGEVAYLLSQGENGDLWGQDLDNGKPKQTAPTFTGAKVYYGYRSCGGSGYTNSENASAQKPAHTGTATDNGDGTHNVTCTACGYAAASENHTLTYTVNGNIITESCSANCGYSASLTLKAPANLVYDRTEKVATVEGEIIADYELTYSADAVIMAGDYTATLTVGDYSVSLDFTIAKADPDVATPTGLTATYGQTLADVELPGGWAWKNSSASVGSVGSNTFAAIYTPANIGNFNTLERDLTVVVAKAMPTVTAPVAADDLVYNGTAQTLITAGTATGGTMQYSLDGSTWSETIPTGKDADTYTVYYKVVGDGNHNDSSVDSVQVTIGKATLTVTADNKTMTTGQNLPTFTYTITGFVNGETEDVLTAKPTVVCVADGKTAGTYDITVSGAEAANYSFSYVKGTLSVVDHQHAWTYTADGNTITATCSAEGCPDPEQSITLAVPENYTYTGEALYSASVDGSIDGVTYTVNYTGMKTNYSSANAPVNADTYTVTLTAGGKSVSGSFTINPKNIANCTAKLSESSFTYDGKAPVLNVTGVDSSVGSYTMQEGTDYTVGTVQVNAGSHKLTVTGIGNYTGTAQLDYTITAKEVSITGAAIQPVTYDPNGYTLTVTGVTFDGVVEDENLAYTATAELTSTNAAGEQDATVTVILDLDNSNYNLVTATYQTKVTINKAAATVTAAPTPQNTLTYTGEALNLINQGEAEGGSMVYSTDNQTWSTDIPQGTAAGEYTVYYKVVGDENHSDTAVASIKVTIAKAQAVITVDTTTITITYGETVSLPTATTNFGNVVCDKTADDLVNAGTYTVTYTVAGTENFEGATKTLTVKVEQLAVAEPTVTGTYIYTGKELTAQLTDVESYMTVASGNKGTNAGNYVVEVTLDGNHKWADGSDGKVSWSIAKAKATITVDTDPITVTYGETVTLPTATTNFGTVVCNKTADDLVNAGTYTVTYFVKGTENFEGAEKKLTVTVAKKTVAEPTVIGTYPYSGSEQTVSLDGFDGEYMTIVSGSKGTNAADYEAVITLDGNHQWADDSDGKVTWTIAPASLETAVITLDQTTYIYDGQPHYPAVTVTLDGKKLAEGTDYKVLYMRAMTMVDGKPTKWFGDHTVSEACINAHDDYYAVVLGLGNYYTEDAFTLYQNFVIQPRPLTIKAADQTILRYDSINRESISITEGSLLQGHTLTGYVLVQNVFDEGQNVETIVGTHKDVLYIDEASIVIKAGEEAVTGNYSITQEKGTLTVVEHTHEWSYTASGDTITATCQGKIGTCDIETVTLKLMAPADLLYDGQAKTVTVTQNPAGILTDVPAVEYQGDCKSTGSHTAKLTCGGATAQLTFTITCEHSFQAGEYLWNESNTACTVTGTCSIGCGATAQAKATVTAQRTKEPTCEDQGETTYTATFQETWAQTQYKTAADIPALNHAWTVTYQWSEDGKLCEALRTCGNDATHNVIVNADITSAVKTPATCEEKGWTTYTATFPVSWAESRTKDVQDIDALNHAWTVSYTWSEDGKTCTATRTCGNDASHNLTAQAAISSQRTKEPTTTTLGETTYTATFQETWATTQSKTVADIPMLHEVEIPENEDGDVTVDNQTPATGDQVTVTVKPDKGQKIEDVTVTGPDGKEIEVTDNGDGTYSYEQPEGDVTIDVTFGIDSIEVELPDDGPTADLQPGDTVEIDGKVVSVDGDGEIWLQDSGSRLLVTYEFNEDTDPHKEYPTAMYAWYLNWTDTDGNGEIDHCEAVPIPELDNFMTYKGTSIRINHSSDGIRFFTAVSGEKLNKIMEGTLLTGDLEGYRLVEMGTLYKWAAPGAELVYANNAKSYVYGGTAGTGFRVFSQEGDAIWYTGMLTELPGDAETLAKDILSRPYAIFENDAGDQVILYGGTIQRSIYYVAQQNQNTWAEGTVYDNYVENIISTVEGTNG